MKCLQDDSNQDSCRYILVKSAFGNSKKMFSPVSARLVVRKTVRFRIDADPENKLLFAVYRVRSRWRFGGFVTPSTGFQ
jgi:hypothetical protein